MALPNNNTDLVKKMVFPYFAYRQARVLLPMPSIAWNRIALSEYIDILILLKEIDPPGSFVRKIRVFYQNYENEVNTNPLLGNLDTLSHTLERLEQANHQAILNLAITLNQIVSAFEKLCFEIVSSLRIGSSQQLENTIQSDIFSMLEQAEPPGWEELLQQKQLEIIQMMKMKNQSPVNLFKINLNRQFAAILLTEKQVTDDMLKNDNEIKELLSVLHKNFFRLIHLVNKKLPAPERHLKVNAAGQELSSPQDYRLSLHYLYNGADEENELANFSHWQNWFR